MLAIKTVAAARGAGVPILVFDEIDTGIGGTTASEVAGALQRLGTTHQVLSISHLHQIAAAAAHHFRVFKNVENGRTISNVEALSSSERITEIARMLGGESRATLDHARELLSASSNK